MSLRGESDYPATGSPERESTDEVCAQVESEGGDPRTEIRRAGLLTFSAERLPIDLAVRDWARRDPAVAERLRRVATTGWSTRASCSPRSARIRTKSRPLRCRHSVRRFSKHFLTADHSERTRLEVVVRAADLLVGAVPEH